MNLFCHWHLLTAKSTLLVLLCIFNIDAIGQHGLKNLRLEGKLHTGYLVPHHDGMQYILEDGVRAFELALTTDSDGRHLWEELYRNPRYGLAYFHNSLGNNAILGKGHSLFAFMDIPFCLRSNKFRLSYQIGFGLAFITETFHPETNPLNLAVSKPLNIFVNIDFAGAYRLNQNGEIKAGVELSHFSNGKTRSPNLGLNMLTASLGYVHNFNLKTKESERIPKATAFRRHLPELIWSMGYKRNDQVHDDIYLASSLSFDYRYALNLKYEFGMGLDFFYDESIGDNKESATQELAENSDAYQMGIHGGMAIRYNNFRVILHMGTYLLSSYNKYASVYTRIGMRYSLGNHVMLNYTLKAHYAIADYMEFGIGYRFGKGKR